MSIVVNYINGDKWSKTVFDEIGAILKLAGAIGAAVGLMGYGGDALKTVGGLKSGLSVFALARTFTSFVRGDLLEEGKKRDNALKLVGIPLHLSKATKFALQWTESSDVDVIRKLCGKAAPLFGEVVVTGSIKWDETSRLKLARLVFTALVIPFAAGWIAPGYSDYAQAAAGITALIALREKQLWFQQHDA